MYIPLDYEGKQKVGNVGVGHNREILGPGTREDMREATGNQHRMKKVMQLGFTAERRKKDT